jgi:hypothetical protein
MDNPTYPLLVHEIQMLWQNVGNILTLYGGTIELVNKANHIGNLYVFDRSQYYIEMDAFIEQVTTFIDQLPNINLFREQVFSNQQQNISYPTEFCNIIDLN